MTENSVETIPEISIGVFSYNQEKFIAQALDSVNHLVDTVFEVWIFDDCSSDSSNQIITDYKFSNENISSVNVILNQINKGLADNLNQFLAEVKTQWLLILAADDFLEPDSLKTYTQIMSEGVDVIWGNLKLVSEESIFLMKKRPVNTWQLAISRSFLKPKIPNNSFVFWNNFVPGGMTLIRTSVAKDAGGWISKIKTEDLGLWLKIRKTARFKFTPIDVGNYRMVEGSLSRNDIDNVYDQARLVAFLQQTKDLNKFQGSIIVNLRIMYTILVRRKINGIIFENISHEANISRLMLFFMAPVSLIAPMLGLIALIPLSLYHKLKLTR